MIDFNDIHAFVVSVEAGGFSAAGQRLHLSRSAVGRAVARLEQRLGTRLLHRTTRKISLTTDGTAFLERCRRALDELQAGQAVLDRGRTEVGGLLRMSVPVLFGRVCVAPVLAALAAEHPALELQIEFSDRVADLVTESFDLAVRNGPMKDAANLIRRKLTRERAVLCAAPSYLDRFGTPDSLVRLPAHHAIGYARRGRVEPWLFPQRNLGPVEIVPAARLQFDDLGAIADAAVAGLGLAWLPDWLIADRLREGALVLVLPDVPRFVREIHTVWPRTPDLPLRVRVVMDALIEQLRDHAG